MYVCICVCERVRAVIDVRDTVPVCRRVLSFDNTATFFLVSYPHYTCKTTLKLIEIIPGADFLKMLFFACVGGGGCFQDLSFLTCTYVAS